MQVTHVWHMCNLHAYQLLRATCTCELFTHVQTTYVCYISKLHIHVATMPHVCYSRRQNKVPITDSKSRFKVVTKPLSKFLKQVTSRIKAAYNSA